MPTIRQLGLGYNLLDEIPNSIISDVSRTLTSLNLARNSFFRLRNNSFPLMPRLATLVLEGCGISIIETGAFKNLPKLTTLYIGRNRLTQLPPALTIPTLRLLSIRENPDQELEGGASFNINNGFNGMSNLIWIDMNYMKLSEIRTPAFYNLTYLTVLLIRGSNIPKVYPGAFETQISLKFLDLGENVQVDVFGEGVFQGLQTLTNLFLDRNYITLTARDKLTVDDLVRTFIPLEKLERLYVAHNGIVRFESAVLMALPHLEVLDLHGNKLEKWPLGTVENVTNIKSIDLSMNSISFLDNGTYNEFMNLRSIDVSDNPFICHCGVRKLIS